MYLTYIFKYLRKCNLVQTHLKFQFIVIYIFNLLYYTHHNTCTNRVHQKKRNQKNHIRQRRVDKGNNLIIVRSTINIIMLLYIIAHVRVIMTIDMHVWGEPELTM